MKLIIQVRQLHLSLELCQQRATVTVSFDNHQTEEPPGKFIGRTSVSDAPERGSMDSITIPEAGDAFHDQVVAGERARLVETADLHFGGEWDTERLRTVHDCRPETWGGVRRRDTGRHQGRQRDGIRNGSVQYTTVRRRHGAGVRETCGDQGRDTGHGTAPYSTRL